jgi:ribosomal protein S18 acetylase RimI-like enzyme
VDAATKIKTKIRAFEPIDRDYEAVASINARAGVDGCLDFEPWTVEEARAFDKVFEPGRYVLQRYVAELEDTGQIVGYAQYNHMPWAFEPRVYWSDIRVDPDFGGRGIGGGLYERVLADLNRLGAEAVWIEAREKEAGIARALERRGFGELLRSLEFVLEMANFDQRKLESAANRAVSASITIVTLPELMERDAGWLPKLYDLHTTVLRDVPLPDEPTISPSVEHFVDYLMKSPESLPDACFIAIDAGGAYVGECVMYKSESDPSALDHLLTGVRREHRGRGVAVALKLETINYALSRGYRRISTWVESNNPGMLAINDKLGFVHRDGLIIFEKRLSSA